MIPPSRWMLDKFSRLLEPDEREAVLGDLTESQVAGCAALRDVFGLVVRRQAALWTNWRAWLALLGVAVPVCVVLTSMSFWLGLSLHMQVRTYWKYGVFFESGLTGSEQSLWFATQALALLVWSWIAGFVVASLSRPTLPITGAFASVIWLYPVFLTFATLAGTAYSAGPAALPLAVFTLMLQSIVHVSLLWLSAVAGVRYAVGRGPLALPSTMMLVILAFALAALAVWTGGWPHAAVLRWSGEAWNPGAGWQLRLVLCALASWPAGCLVVISRRPNGSRRRG